MINDNVELNLKNLNFKENKDKKNIFLSKKHSKTGDLFLQDFEDGLNISGIENKEENQKYIKRDINNNNINKDEDFNEDLDNFNDSESIIRKLSFDSIHIDFNYKDICNNKQKIFKKKKTKEDLNNTPLPIFDCIYCTNEKIVFSNFINRILSDKYLFLTSIYDIKDLNKLIIYQPLIDKNKKNDKLLNIIIKNTEYISQFIQKEKNITYFSSNSFKNLCEQYKFNNHRLIKQKIEDSLVRKKKDFYFKGINKISKNSVNNKCLFNSTNSLINNFNALSGLVEPIPQHLISIKNNYTIVSGSNNSINFNSLSLNNNEFVCYNNKENNNMLDYIVEKIEKKDESANYGEDKDEIMDFFKFDLVRKISKNDIKWENKYYDIYNPEISFDYQDESEQDNFNDLINNKNLNLNINKNIIKSDKNLFNIYNVENKHKKLETQNFTLKINHILKDKFYNFNNVNKPFSAKSLNYNTIQKESKKLKNNKIIVKDINLNKSIALKNVLNKSTSKSLLNNKFSISHLKSFYSSSTIDNSSNINKNSLVGLKNTCKYYENKLKNKKIIISYGSKKSINNNSSSNYSIGVNIPIRLNTSMKSNNCIKYNYSNTGTYSKNKSTLIYDYKLKNKIPNKNNNYINTSLNFKNKSNITYKYHLKSKKPNFNILKNNKLYKLFNISKLINLNNIKSNYEIKNINKKEDNINICKSQNKRGNKNSYINYNLLNLKEKKTGLNKNSITNNIKSKNNLLKSGIILSSNSLIANINNNKLPHKKSFIFNFINNKNNSYSNINTTKINLKNNNSSSLYNKLYDNQLNKKYYTNNKTINKKDLFLNKKKNNTFYQYQTHK